MLPAQALAQTRPGARGAVLLHACQYLDFQRATILAKTDGLDREQMARRHPPSELSLAGLLYHLALVEEAWMEKRLLGL